MIIWGSGDVFFWHRGLALGVKRWHFCSYHLHPSCIECLGLLFIEFVLKGIINNVIYFREFVLKGVINEDGKRDIHDMLEACFNKFTESSQIENLLKNVVEIASFKKQVSLSDGLTSCMT